MAHSLGNMMVNSALTFLEPGVIDTYVMNEAAVPTEAFLDVPYQQIQDMRLFDSTLLTKAQSLGFSTGPDIDLMWKTGWQAILNARDSAMNTQECSANVRSGLPGGCGAVYYNLWKSRAGSSLDDAALGQKYETRWTQVRTAPWDLSHGLVGLQTGGPWRGLFAHNLQKTRVVNTWNADDWVLNTPWYRMQWFQKPGNGLVFADDNAVQQIWGVLKESGEDERYLWNRDTNHNDPAEAAAERNLTRQWAELSHWFTSLTLATGRQGTVAGHDFTGWAYQIYDASAVLVGPQLESHSYMQGDPFPKVWGAWRTIVDELTKP